MVFPNSNLPSTAQPWARDVQKRIEAVESNVKANEFNNTARDVQLDNNYKRIDKAVNDLVVADAAITIATQQAQQAADDAAAAASAANSAATTANNAINAITGLGTPGSSTTVNASNISGGTITGVTFRTAASGQRVELSGTSEAFYNSSGYTGSIYGSVDQGSNSITTTSGAGQMSVFGYGGAGGGVFMGGSGTSLLVGDGNLGTVISSQGTTYINGGSMRSNCSTNTFVNSTTFSGTATLNSDVYSSGIYNATSSVASNVHIQGSANSYRLYRSTATSSRNSKRDIRELEFNSDAYIGIKPVVFKYNEGILREEEKDWDIIGFIAEDFEDAGFGEQLVMQPDSEDEMIQLRYDKMYMFLHKVVAEQQQTIKDLTARIEALESKV